MPGWVKGLLIGFGVVLLLAVIVIGAGVFYVMRNKDAWMAKAKEVAEEGKRFGETADNQGCVDEGVNRYKKAPGITAVISNTVFMRMCLEASKPTPGFCDEVPRATEFMKSAEWRLKQCRQAGLQSDSNCQNLFTPIQQFCETLHNRPRENSSNDNR